MKSLAILDLSNNQLSGPLVDYSNTSISTLILKNNQLSGEFNAAFIPQNSLVVDLSYNQFSSNSIVLNKLGKSTVLLDLSFNKMVLDLTLEDLQLQPRTSDIALRLGGNVVYCPVPSTSDLNSANGVSFVLLNDFCRTNYQAGLYLYILFVVGLITGITALIARSCMSRFASKDRDVESNDRTNDDMIKQETNSISSALTCSFFSSKYFVWFVIVLRLAACTWDIVNDVIVYKCKSIEF